MTEDAELLAHYLERGTEPWNVSLEAAWLDFELRAWVRPRLPTSWSARVANIGIGSGLWDDWLGYELGISITSIDRDPDVCRRFRLRQRRERNPHPALVRAGDVRDPRVVGTVRFDAITIVGFTLAETGDRASVEAAAFEALAPGGVLLLAEVGNRQPPPADEVRSLGEIWIAFRSRRAAE